MLSWLQQKNVIRGNITLPTTGDAMETDLFAFTHKYNFSHVLKSDSHDVWLRRRTEMHSLFCRVQELIFMGSLVTTLYACIGPQTSRVLHKFLRKKNRNLKIAQHHNNDVPRFIFFLKTTIDCLVQMCESMCIRWTNWIGLKFVLLVFVVVMEMEMC